MPRRTCEKGATWCPPLFPCCLQLFCLPSLSSALPSLACYPLCLWPCFLSWSPVENLPSPPSSSRGCIFPNTWCSFEKYSLLLSWTSCPLPLLFSHFFPLTSAVFPCSLAFPVQNLHVVWDLTQLHLSQAHRTKSSPQCWHEIPKLFSRAEWGNCSKRNERQMAVSTASTYLLEGNKTGAYCTLTDWFERVLCGL